MSILTDYYCFERLASKSKTRLDCTVSTASYPEFEEKRKVKATKATKTRDATNVGDLIAYFVDVPEQFGGNIHRKADKSITINGKNISSVYMPDPSSNFGYGDVSGTADALLFLFDSMAIVNDVVQEGAILEVFVARGRSHNQVGLYNMLTDGALDEEMSELRGKAEELQNQ